MARLSSQLAVGTFRSGAQGLAIDQPGRCDTEPSQTQVAFRVRWRPDPKTHARQPELRDAVPRRPYAIHHAVPAPVGQCRATLLRGAYPSSKPSSVKNASDATTGRGVGTSVKRRLTAPTPYANRDQHALPRLRTRCRRAQELQTALLLAAGESTREAATAMFRGPKTIEYRLRHVYQKLGIHSREELAQALANKLRSVGRTYRRHRVGRTAPI